MLCYKLFLFIFLSWVIFLLSICYLYRIYCYSYRCINCSCYFTVVIVSSGGGGSGNGGGGGGCGGDGGDGGGGHNAATLLSIFAFYQISQRFFPYFCLLSFSFI